jgi:hypothetical protein
MSKSGSTFMLRALGVAIAFTLTTAAYGQNSYPVPKSALAALAAEQTKIPPKAQVLQQLQVEKGTVLRSPSQITPAEVSRIPPQAQTVAKLATEAKTIPSLSAILALLKLEAAKIPPQSALVPWKQ